MRRLPGLAALLVAALAAQAQQQSLPVAPQATDARLAPDEPPHWVVYDPAAAEPLLVWLPGTNGRPADGPREFFETVRASGYRLIGVSYLDTPAVSQVCVGRRLREQPGCAAAFRQQRVWGDAVAAPIGDRPEDAIVSRLVRLLHYLAERDAPGRWAAYLDGDEPRWSRIVLAGQSQGGGMAAYLAKTRSVAGLLMFSGGWDQGANGGPAPWYRRGSATPPERWHATYNRQEPQAGALAQTYTALGIPVAQMHALDLPVVRRTAHGDGIGNPAYAPLWRDMLRAVREP